MSDGQPRVPPTCATDYQLGQLRLPSTSTTPHLRAKSSHAGTNPYTHIHMYCTRARGALARAATSIAQHTTRPTHSTCLDTIRHYWTQGQVVTLVTPSCDSRHLGAFVLSKRLSTSLFVTLGYLRCHTRHTRDNTSRQQGVTHNNTSRQRKLSRVRHSVPPQQRHRGAPPWCRAPLILAAWQLIEMEHWVHTRCTITVADIRWERGERGERGEGGMHETRSTLEARLDTVETRG